MDTNKRKKNILISLTFIFSLGIIMIFAVTIGPANVSFSQAANIIGSKIPFINNISDLSNVKNSQETIILQVRLPRIILSALTGMALAAVGTTFQGLLKNPMADPYIIGVSSGSALGASLAIVTGVSISIGYFMVPFAAFIGALISIFTVYNIARIGNKIPVYNLLLSGVALSSFLSAFTSLLMILNSNETSQILYWMLGSFSGKTWE
ncbi:MAG: iron chelate uptake ABC transporter family permease subunit, partial [Eubacteriales bacterium]|nr:iron chelate uptake ABC transporter family permease subunit [Eubacteriales bacterium]